MLKLYNIQDVKNQLDPERFYLLNDNEILIFWVSYVSMMLWNDILWDQSVCLCFDANDIIYSCLFLWYYDTQHTSLIQDNISLDKTFRISELSIDPI